MSRISRCFLFITAHSHFIIKVHPPPFSPLKVFIRLNLSCCTGGSHAWIFRVGVLGGGWCRFPWEFQLDPESHGPSGETKAWTVRQGDHCELALHLGADHAQFAFSSCPTPHPCTRWGLPPSENLRTALFQDPSLLWGSEM